MNKPTTIPASVVQDALDHFDPSDAYGYWGDRGQVIVLGDDDDNPQWRITFKVRPDEDTRIDDFDCYGLVEPETIDRDTGYSRRPEGFDGDARKITVRGDTYWWQPMWKAWGVERADLTPDRIRREVQQIRDLIEYGFNILVAEVAYRCDCCEGWKECAYATLGGIDSMADGERTLAADVLGMALDDADITVEVVPDELLYALIDKDGIARGQSLPLMERMAANLRLAGTDSALYEVNVTNDTVTPISGNTDQYPYPTTGETK